jgi:hypothetical protein
MSLVIGIHGIAQQQLGRSQLKAPWQAAFSDGLEKACRHRVPLPPLDIAYYGDLFVPPVTSGKAASELDEVLLDDLTGDEAADLEAAARELLSDEDLAAADAARGKAYTRTPLPLQRMLRALDRRFGASAGVLSLGEFRQVRRYLCDPGLKKEADALVDGAVDPDCRILVGHSLGSVVAWEYVRRHPEHPLDLLLTVGSPLGLRMIRSRLPVPDFAAGTRPAHIAAWVNVRDPRDPVACAGVLTPWWQWSTDLPVNNQGDAHSATRYLGQRETGKAVLARAPELAGP